MMRAETVIYSAEYFELADRAPTFERAWRTRQLQENSLYPTPRQAAAIESCLSYIAEFEAKELLLGGVDLQVSMRIGDNGAWLAKAYERCEAVAAEVRSGVLPFDRRGCVFDELAIAIALPHAEVELRDMPDAFAFIAQSPIQWDRGETESDEFIFWRPDDDWDSVLEYFDLIARWSSLWLTPTINNHPLLGYLLTVVPPVEWFDPFRGG